MKLSILEIFAERTRNFVLIILSLLFVCVVIWILMTLVSSQNTSQVPDTSKKLAEPLNPVLDTSKLDKLDTKKYYSPEELQSFPINVNKKKKKTRSKRVIQIEPT